MAAVEKLVTDHLDLWSAAIKRKSATGRGSSSKVELYGIKKLRELILQLAVRGLLVPQDPNDEPVSELLKKIAAEKAKLVKEGKIKKHKPLPVIATVAKPFELPATWVWQHLADVFYPISVSKNKVKTSELSEQGKHPVVDQGQSFIAGYVDDDNLLNVLPGPVIVFGDHTSALKYIDFNFVAGADGVKILRPMCCNERFFFLVCKTLPIESRGYGRHYSRLIDNLFPLPPLAEQHRIVAKVDELMALCDQLEQQTDACLSAHQTLVETLLNALTSAADQAQFAGSWQRISEHFDILFTTEESINQLKQTLLQLAVMGKLVPQDPNDEPASELLKKIAAEKAKQVKAGKIRQGKVLPLMAEGEMQKLPSCWSWTCMAALGEIAPRNEVKDAVIASFVPMSLISTRFDGRHDHELKTWAEIKKGYTHFADGDVAIAKITPCFENSKAAIFSGLHNGVGAGTTELHVVRPIGEFVSRSYLLLYLKSPQFLRVGETKMTGSAGQKRVPTEFFSFNPLPLPPLSEQHRIVAKIDELMALCDQLKSRLSDAQITQLHLADALTEKALARE